MSSDTYSSDIVKDITPGQQAEYEAALAKKARLGRVLAVLICDIFALLGLLPKNAVLTALAGVCLFLTLTGRPPAKWLAMALGGFYAAAGALALADTAAPKNAAPGITENRAYSVFLLVFGILSAALFCKSRLIAAYFEYRASIKRKII